MTLDLSRRRYLATVGSTAVAVGLAGCGGGGGDGGGGGTTVEMRDDLTYEPETITVSVGDTVTWTTVGTVGHTVTAYGNQIPDGAEYWASGGFDSEQAARDAYVPGDTDAGDVPNGESWSHTFETAGTHEYFCIPHESADMVGTVEVQEG